MNPTQADIRIANQDVTTKIETVFRSIIDALLQKRKQISISILAKNRSGPPKKFTVNFPGSSSQESWRFGSPNYGKRDMAVDKSLMSLIAVLFRILGLVHEALSSGRIISKRNIYYQDPTLFRSQSVVDRYIDILAFTIGVERSALNVCAAGKGLMSGEINWKNRNGLVIERSSETSPKLIDNVYDIHTVDMFGIAWILVIEKESTFRTLASSNICHTCKAGKGVIITAKGYPDISSRAFLHLLSTSGNIDTPKRSLPIFALMDFDPDGINIMSTYKHGSWNLSHENAKLIVPLIRWLGIKSADLYGGEALSDGAGLLRLSVRDRKKATKMLEWNIMKEDGPETEWRRELQVMLMLNFKAEMELLGEREGAVERWVEEKLVLEMGCSELEHKDDAEWDVSPDEKEMGGGEMAGLRNE